MHFRGSSQLVCYNESTDLSVQIEFYRECFGFSATKIYVDKICMNKEKRKLMKELGVQLMGEPPK